MMMTTHDQNKMANLDALLSQAASENDVPPGLSARVMEDARRIERRPVAPPDRSFWHKLRDGLGGWQGLGGLVAATCAGFWIGVSPPAGLPDTAALLIGIETDSSVDEIAAFSEFGWDQEEG
jgi:hypothetical protein